MRVLSLRPHHALCLLLFHPKGHSVRYANKMRQLIDTITQEKIQTVRMTAELDEICGHCPYNKQGHCEKSDEVSRSDAEILARCGLTVGESISWVSLRRRLLENIVAPNALSCVCAGCVYIERCKHTATAQAFAV